MRQTTQVRPNVCAMIYKTFTGRQGQHVEHHSNSRPIALQHTSWPQLVIVGRGWERYGTLLSVTETSSLLALLPRKAPFRTRRTPEALRGEMFS
jgi:hypothetical protein